MSPPRKEQSNYLTIANVICKDLYYQSLFNTHIYSLIEHVVDSIINAENCISSISENINDIILDVTKKYSIDFTSFINNTNLSEDLLKYPGMSGTKTRHLYNNICNLYNKINIDTNYFEIGTFYGSSSIAAMFNNHINDSLFIDNWAQFGGYKSKFIEAIEKFKTKKSKYSFIENDCWQVDISQLPQNYFNIYLFDGEHTELDHYQSLSYYIDILQETFIFLIDDWNFSHVRDGTMRAITELNLIVNFRHEIFISPHELKNMPSHEGKHTFWNGVGIFVLTKSKI